LQGNALILLVFVLLMDEELSCERCELSGDKLSCIGCRLVGKTQVRRVLMILMGVGASYLLISLLTTSIYQIPLVAGVVVVALILSLYSMYLLSKGWGRSTVAVTATATAIGLAITLIIFAIGVTVRAAGLGSGWVIYAASVYELTKGRR